MSTVAEAVCTHPTVNENHCCAECGVYFMPEAKQGMCVKYYDPTLVEHKCVIGYVLKIARSKRTITVDVPGYGIREQVRHISDPKLGNEEAKEHRENGAWDYSDDWKATNQRFSELEAKIAALQHRGKKAD